MKGMAGMKGGSGMPKPEKMPMQDKHAQEHATGMGEHSKNWDEATCRKEMGKVMGDKKGKMGGM